MKESPYARPDDENYDGDDLFLKRLVLFFKESMTWVNNPPCVVCGSDQTTMAKCTGPITTEEREGEASRVERYHCPKCNDITTSFPRYNNPRAILKTRKGRCGEYANLFGLYCRASGFDVRYISDFTDHVWVEVWSNRLSRWIMADGCEGQIDSPSMYEKGWGKKLNYILAFTIDSVTDVTRRYTRQFIQEEFQARRRKICPEGEYQSDMIIAQFNTGMRSNQNIRAVRIGELDRRNKMEQAFFRSTETSGQWDGVDYSEGRISGSLAWRACRGEVGDKQVKDVKDKNKIHSVRNEISSSFYHVESFHPSPNYSSKCSITVTAPPSPAPPSYRGCICVSGVQCGVGVPKSASVVIIDELHFCILQSRTFCDWFHMSKFLDTVPNNRVVAICADILLKDVGKKEKIMKAFHRIRGLDLSVLEEKEDHKYLLFVGQIGLVPSWKKCMYEKPGKVLVVNIDIERKSQVSLKLRCENNTVPTMISMRLPETVMPLKQQITATEEEKNCAFLNFVVEESNKHYVGYCTKRAAPIYLLKKSAFPLKKYCVKEPKNSDYALSWSTHHFLPEPLVEKSIVKNILKENLLENFGCSYLERSHDENSCSVIEDSGEVSVNRVERNETKTKTTNQISGDEKQACSMLQLNSSSLIGMTEIKNVQQDAKRVVQCKVKNKLVAQTAKKYLDNVQKNPSTYLYRSFKMTNKIFDQITSSIDGIEHVTSFGFSIYCNDVDFMACIPLSADLESINKRIIDALD